MLTFLDRSAGKVLGIKAGGKLSHADYQRFVPKLEQLIRQHGKARVLFELEDCQGWEIAAAWDDLKFGLKHGGDVERCAVVGEKKWQEWMTKLSRPFFNVKYFEKAELDEAWQWVLDGDRDGSKVANDDQQRRASARQLLQILLGHDLSRGAGGVPRCSFQVGLGETQC